MSKIFEDLHTAFLLFQRKVRRVRTSYPLPVNIQESIVVTFLSYESRTSVQHSLPHLDLSNPSISRLLQRLVKRGTIKSTRSKADRRVKTFEFTPSGKALLRELDHINTQISAAVLSDISKTEKNELRTFFKQLIDGLGTADFKYRNEEDRYEFELSRLTAGTGVVGSNYMGTGMDILRYQIMLELFLARAPIRFADFLIHISTSPTGLSRILEALEQEGLVTKSIPDHDRRTSIFKFTAKGRNSFAAIHTKVAARYEGALRSVPKQNLKRYIEILTKATARGGAEFDSDQISVRRVESGAELMAARAVVLEALVKEGQHKRLDQNSILIGQKVYGAFAGKNLQAILEVSSARGGATIERFSSLTPTRSGAPLNDLLFRCLKKVFEDLKVAEVKVIAGALSPSLFKDSRLKTFSGNSFAFSRQEINEILS